MYISNLCYFKCHFLLLFIWKLVKLWRGSEANINNHLYTLINREKKMHSMINHIHKSINTASIRPLILTEQMPLPFRRSIFPQTLHILVDSALVLFEQSNYIDWINKR